jgi:flagellar assembly protein FliH
MAIKIIKNNSSEAFSVQNFSFSGNSNQAIEAQPVVETVQLPVAPPQVQRIKREQLPAPSPVADAAAIEKSAYENGFRQGEKTGMEMAEKKVESLMRRYAEVVLEIGKIKAGLYSQVEREVVKLAVEVAKKIVCREIQADPEVIQALVRVALSHVAEKSAVTVHLHPTDYNFVLEHRSQLMAPGESGCEVVLLADKGIERGGCLVETECGEIDARIEERFREVERGFFEEMK